MDNLLLQKAIELSFYLLQKKRKALRKKRSTIVDDDKERHEEKKFSYKSVDSDKAVKEELRTIRRKETSPNGEM
jgi:hypothetical protein